MDLFVNVSLVFVKNIFTKIYALITIIAQNATPTFGPKNDSKPKY